MVHLGRDASERRNDGGVMKGNASLGRDAAHGDGDAG
jgi:hypothetical protein